MLKIIADREKTYLTNVRRLYGELNPNENSKALSKGGAVKWVYEKSTGRMVKAEEQKPSDGSQTASGGATNFMK